MKLQVGLVAPSSAWTRLCEQEGVPWVPVDLSISAVADECSLLVVNKSLGPQERDAVEQYLRGGGAVIGYTLHLNGVAGVGGTGHDLAYIVADHDEIFPSLFLLDLDVHGLIPRGANALRTDTGMMAVRAGVLGGGFAVVFPFDVDTLFHDTRAANKSFYFTVDRLPSERVSLVAKGELRLLVHSAFEYLHRMRGMPYAHLWYFPRDSRSVFAFRIDSDGASREEIDALYRISRDHDVAMSWFLDVKSHESWLDHFGSFVDQEIGLHCYEHRTYPTREENLQNIKKGLQELRRAGLQPSGFAAPLGIWNAELGKAVDETGFEYSSEFSLAYDTLPLWPEAEGVRFKTLQVPVHPICIGSLMKVGYSDERMMEYFSMVARQKLSRSEPLFFYHHPSHRREKVVESIVGPAEQGVENLTMGAYARWWKKRNGARYLMHFENDKIQIEHTAAPFPDDVWLRVVNTDGVEAIQPLHESIDPRSVPLSGRTGSPCQPPADIRRAREFDPRRKVGEIFDSLVRRIR